MSAQTKMFGTNVLYVSFNMAKQTAHMVQKKKTLKYLGDYLISFWMRF